MKTYVLIVSKTFPKNHAKAFENTNFIEKILMCIHYLTKTDINKALRK